MLLKKVSKYFNSKENNDINDFIFIFDFIIVIDIVIIFIIENYIVWYNFFYKICNNDKRNIDWFYIFLKKVGWKCIMCDICL